MSDPGITGSSLNIVQQLQRHEGDFVPSPASCKKHHLKLQQAQVSVPWHVSARAMPCRLCTAPLIPPPRLPRAQPVLSSLPAPHTEAPQAFPGRQRRRCPGRGPALPGHATACPPAAGAGSPLFFATSRCREIPAGLPLLAPRSAPAFANSSCHRPERSLAPPSPAEPSLDAPRPAEPSPTATMMPGRTLRKAPPPAAPAGTGG